VLPDRTVLAATWTGMFRSSDAGATWQPTATRSSVPFAEAILGTEHRLFAAAADGLYSSTDDGASWQRVLVDSRILSLAASGDGHLVLAGSERDGVLRSEDAGLTWSGASVGLRDSAVLSLALSPDFARDHMGFAGTSTGLYRTRSGARAWREVD